MINSKILKMCVIGLLTIGILCSSNTFAWAEKSQSDAQNNPVAEMQRENKAMPIRQNATYNMTDGMGGWDGTDDADTNGRIIARVSGSLIQPFSSFQTGFLGLDTKGVESLMTLPAKSRAPADTLRLITLKDKSKAALNAALETLNKTHGIVYAEPDYIMHTTQTIPNDKDFGTPSNWGMQKIHAPYAWDTQTGSRDVVVAVIDSGVDIHHPDLAANIWTNTGEIKGDGIDNDSNGYDDDINGYSFLWGEDESNSVMDSNGHGTHVAGIIGAVGGNHLGMAGVSWKTRIMSVKAMANIGSGATSDLIKAINYANTMGADIVNNSYGGSEYSQAQRDAIAASPALFVVAAGNDSSNNDSLPNYPASYDCSNIITVAATRKDDSLADFSNFGVGSVDIAAPGDGIFSTLPAGTYGLMSGTSMAAPFVAGAAALVLSQNPTMTTAQLKTRLIQSVDTIPALAGIVASGGRLNVYKAIDPSAPNLPEYQPLPMPTAPEFVEFAGGDGSEQNPYQVSTPLQLNSVRNHMGSNFIQINDIDMTFDTQDPQGAFYNESEGWIPLGAVDSNSSINLSGKYDGGRHKIIGLRSARSYSVISGLFAVSENGEIVNVGLSDCDIIGLQPGGIAARNFGLIQNCFVTGAVTGLGYVGGIACLSGGDIIGCYNGATVSEVDDYVAIVGGITSGGSRIKDCYNTGELKAPYAPDNRLGGILAYGNGNLRDSVDNCFTVGTAVNMYGSGAAPIAQSGDFLSRNSYCLGKYNGNVGIEVSESAMKKQSTFNGWDFDDVWQIQPVANNGYPYLRGITNNFEPFTLDFSLDVSGENVFASAIEFYDAPLSLEVTVTSTGNYRTGQLIVELSGEDSDAFELSASTIGSIEVGENAEFSVAPKSGLWAGDYSATVTVSGEGGISKEFSVSFSVVAIPDFALSLPLGYDGGEIDLGLDGWQNVTVTKTSGNEKIVWNADQGRLEISEGLVAGTYNIQLFAANSAGEGKAFGATVTVGTIEERVVELERQLQNQSELSEKEIKELESQLSYLQMRLFVAQQELYDLADQLEDLQQEMQALKNQVGGISSKGTLAISIIAFVLSTATAALIIFVIIKKKTTP